VLLQAEAYYFVQEKLMQRLFLLILMVIPTFAQQFDLDGYIRLLKVAPGDSVADKVKSLDSLGITLSERGMRQLSIAAATSAPTSTTYQPAFPSYGVAAPVAPAAPFGSPQLRSTDSQRKKLGDLNSNPYDPNSISDPYGQYGSPYSPDSVNNPYGVYGSPYSPYSSTNPYATQAPSIVTPNGKYLGKFSANPYDPDSTANPYGQYGSPYSPNSINNPYGTYGSPYSPSSVRNPLSVGTSGPSLPSMPMPSIPSLPRLPALPSLPPLPKY
jgi:hypothetical protein